MNQGPGQDQGLRRRQFFRLGLGSLAACTLPTRAFSFFESPLAAPGTLSLYHIHTGESFAEAFRREGDFDPDFIAKISHFLRDHRSGEVGQIDSELINLLHELSSNIACGQPLHVVCGYRSAKTNEAMWKQGRGVARNSLHIFGKAVDIRLPGCSLSRLRRAAVDLKAGGVGFYPRSDFIHLDTGRLRSW